jgi:16S rRNA (uracil1498-N3)-methyltransferase
MSLSGSEAHHLLHVMRASPGEHVVLFDGRGGQYDAEVVVCGRKTIRLAIGTHSPEDCELAFELTIGMPLPKGERQRWLVEKLVELGVNWLVPLVTTRSSSHGENRTSAKLASYVVGATKQCGRNMLMEIAPVGSWEEWLARSAPRRLIAHAGGRPLEEIDLSRPETTLITIGPEGGLTGEEVARAIDQGWQMIDLGSRTLRMETAAMVLAAAVGVGSREPRAESGKPM